MLQVASTAVFQQATPDFITFHDTYNYAWLSGMCELLELPAAASEACIALAEAAIASLRAHIQAVEIAGYLRAAGVRSCFGRCYGADLINTFKQGPVYFERLFADLGLRPAEALVVDNGVDVLRWEDQVGARTLLISPTLLADQEMTACIRSLAELPSWLQQQV